MRAAFCTLLFYAGLANSGCGKPPTPSTIVTKSTEKEQEKADRVVGKLDVPEDAIEPGRFHLPPGYVIEMAANPDLTGSILSMEAAGKRTLFISREPFDKENAPFKQGGILLLKDENGNGTYETATLYTDRIQASQGLVVYDSQTLYVTGEGPQGAGLYRLRDRNNDDQADDMELIQKYSHAGMHGMHAVVLGPDGNLYVCAGNHTDLSRSIEGTSPTGIVRTEEILPPSTQENNSPVQIVHAAELLPPYDHVDSMSMGSPLGGTIWKFSPDGRECSLEAVGFRNHFDCAFSDEGEMFTEDSDMEWDEDLPWYRPVRALFVPAGADFGWRHFSNKLPPYDFDTVPALADIGRGSPTGIVVYHHHQFPDMYGTNVSGDWGRGRILANKPEHDGASYRGEPRVFISGKALNVTDMTIEPDGSLLVGKGGFGTDGGIYRVRYVEEKAKVEEKEESLSQFKNLRAVWEAIEQPQPESAWGRARIKQLKEQAGGHWGTGLESIVQSADWPLSRRLRAVSYLLRFGPTPSLELALAVAKDEDAVMRAQAARLLSCCAAHTKGADAHHDVPSALKELLMDTSPLVQRRALESFLRLGVPPPLRELLPLLRSDDRFVQYAARLNLERMPADEWRQDVLGSENSRICVNGIVALSRMGILREDPNAATTVFQRVHDLFQSPSSPQEELNTVRALQLALTGTAKEQRPEDIVTQIGGEVLQKFSAADGPLRWELARTIAALDVPGGIAALLDAMEAADATSQRGKTEVIFYAQCLENMRGAWTLDQRSRLLHLFEQSQEWEGGKSFQAYLHRMFDNIVTSLKPEECFAFLEKHAEFPRTAHAILGKVSEQSDLQYIGALETLFKTHVFPVEVIAALGRSKKLEAEHLLHEWYREYHAYRGVISQALKNSSLFQHRIATLGESNQAGTAEQLRTWYEEYPEHRAAIIRALAQHPSATDRQYFIAALQGGDREMVQRALAALRNMEMSPEQDAAYRRALAEADRTATKLEQGTDDSLWQSARRPRSYVRSPKSPWKIASPQLEAALLQQVNALEASPARGQNAYKKNCASCHRLNEQGRSVGPDLANVAGRFSKEDIFRSIVSPSAEVSEQYRTVIIATIDGRTITGLPGAESATHFTITRQDGSTQHIDKKTMDGPPTFSEQSIMPANFSETLSPQELADLLAYLAETRAAEVGTSPRK